ncbi:thiamine diphosphokinase [Culicoidibacter larvae]|uniref:Thiamine diphosphokinase n=1 Tax=Culicoidibacter larvae TaxID=2579976 RepID=A0A5R8QDI5_9FIRM|nr:thiamine diphosphokinase [Culicoidibacter larvae]TLG75264.1 thiamine diphosphokinase [Culicoidibacter larvae]
MKVAIITYRQQVGTIDFKAYDYVIATDASAGLLYHHGVPFDYAIGDFDTIDPETLQLLHKTETQVITLDAHKDITDTEAALQLAKELEATMIDIYSSFGGRIDQQLTFIGFLTNAVVPTKIILDDAQMELLTPGAYEFEPVNTDYLSLIALEPVNGLYLDGVEYPLNNATIAPFSDLTVSNELKESSLFHIKFNTGKLLYIQIFRN